MNEIPDGLKLELERFAATNPNFAEAVNDYLKNGGESLNVAALPNTASGDKTNGQLSLAELEPRAAEALKAFDYDGDGIVSDKEIQRGAEQLKSTARNFRRAIWAIVAQFVVYSVVMIACCFVLYRCLFLLKDTVVDESTGNLMFKTDGGGMPNVEVSVKSHGEAFSYDGTVPDSSTGVDKGCVSASTVAGMFLAVSQGTPSTFVEQDPVNGDARVVPIGNSRGAYWTNSTVVLSNELALTPDLDCARKFLDDSSSSSNNNNNKNRRSLSAEDLIDSHARLRDLVMSGLVQNGEANNGRRLDMAQLAMYSKIDFNQCECVQELLKANNGRRLDMTQLAMYSTIDFNQCECVQKLLNVT